MSRRTGFIIAFFLVSTAMLKAQSGYLDSLKRLVPNENDSIESRVTRQIMQYFVRLKSDSSLYYGNKLIKMSIEGNRPYALAQAYSGLAGYYYGKGQLDSTLANFQRTADLAEKHQWPDLASQTVGNIGIIHYGRGKYEKALESFMQRLRIVEERAKTEQRMKKPYSGSLSNISAVYARMGMDSLSVVYALKSLRVKEEIFDSVGMVGTLSVIASTFLDSNKLDSGLYYSRRHLLVAEALKFEREVASAYNNLGVYFNHKLVRKPDSAQYYLERGLTLSRKTGDNETTASVLLNLSNIFRDKSDFGKSYESANDALRLYEVLKLPREIAKAKDNLAYSLSKLGRYKEAFQHQKELQALRDSIFNEDKADAVTAMQVEYETDKKNQQIALQESQLETSAAIISRQTLTRNIAITGAAVLILVVLLIYRNNRLKTRTSHEIAIKNDQLGKALDERESLLKEIHHRVKNNLQVIASLLYLQSDKSEDVNVKRLLEEGQGRVRSMALIHQKLYENEDLKHIPFEDYLKELVSEIQKTFGTRAEAVVLKIEAKGIQFDVDTAVPLGLIINELSTNAFKYAYTNKMGGALFSIKLEQNHNGYQLTVADNGAGIPDEALNNPQSSSLGLRLTRMLSDQLEGDYEFENSAGTRFKLNFAV